MVRAGYVKNTLPDDYSNVSRFYCLRPIQGEGVEKTAVTSDHNHTTAVESSPHKIGQTMKRHTILAVCILALSLMFSFITAGSFLSMRKTDKYYPSASLTEIKNLSDYFDGIKHTRGDTPVYFFEGEEPGGTLLILGGTHPDEPAGNITAVCLIENIGIHTGRIIIIPRANNSGYTHSDPQEGNPQRYHFTTQSGERWFRYGSRSTNPIDQWPDPEVYRHFPSGQKLSGAETRNLNRAYPGRPDGTFTEKVTYAIMQLMEKESVSLGIDIHEASLEYPVVNAIVAHPMAFDLAGEAMLYLQMEGFEFRLEQSPPNFRGLSHREWGDRLQIPAILMETGSTIHGRYHGSKNEEKIITGIDRFYAEAEQHGLLSVKYPDNGLPMKERVGRHLLTITKILEIWNSYNPEESIIAEHIPDFHELQEKGIGHFLH
jgi:predicted deacylase